MSLPKPPMLPGLPLLGNALEFRKDPIKLFMRGYQELGRVFSIRLGPKPAAVILGPDNHRFFFTETGNILSMPEVYKFLIPMFGKVTFAAEPEEYEKQRSILQPSFQGHKMDGYVEAMIQETLDWLDTLGGEGEFDLCASFEQLSMYTAASALLGKDFRQRLGREFWALYRDVAGGMEFILPTNLPLPRFRRRDKARIKLHAMIYPIIAERRAHPGNHNDFLQDFAEATYADGKTVPEDTIVSLLLILVFAAHETTAAQACWGLIQLLQHPTYLALVLGEQEEVLGTRAENISMNTLRKLERLEWALNESARMRPVTTMLTRYTAKSYDLGGFNVPHGWLTVISPPISHRLPEVFTNPDVYDPDRFSSERAEDRKSPFSLVSFGGGIHKCMGIHFASNEMKTILSLLLNRYSLNLVDPDPKPDYTTGLTRPKSPCLVRYKRKS